MIWILIASIVGCITIAMIFVGRLNDCKSCSSAALFLIISGAVGCIGSIIAILLGIFDIFEKKFAILLVHFLAFLRTLAIAIWGSVGKFLDFAVKSYLFQTDFISIIQTTHNFMIFRRPRKR